MPEFRSVLAVLALGIVAFAMGLEATGHPVAEWLKAPIGGILGVLLGYYFVDSARKAQGSAVQAPPAPSGGQVAGPSSDAATDAKAGG